MANRIPSPFEAGPETDPPTVAPSSRCTPRSGFSHHVFGGASASRCNCCGDPPSSPSRRSRCVSGLFCVLSASFSIDSFAPPFPCRHQAGGILAFAPPWWLSTQKRPLGRDPDTSPSKLGGSGRRVVSRTSTQVVWGGGAKGRDSVTLLLAILPQLGSWSRKLQVRVLHKKQRNCHLGSPWT